VYAAFIGTQGEYGYAKANLRAVEPEPLPDTVPFEVYSSLMGMLASSGASLVPGPNWYWYPETIVLKLSNTNLEFLHWLMEYFSCMFSFDNTPKLNNLHSQSYRVFSSASSLALAIWAHWNDEYLTTNLPLHFAHYFSWHTLAFWAMKSGKYSGNYFYIHVSRLAAQDKQLLITLLKSKCGLDSKLTMKGNKLAISNPTLVVDKLRPLFHESQLYRLAKA
jgi:hypothetical protein